jgi:hypothetical protein
MRVTLSGLTLLGALGFVSARAQAQDGLPEAPPPPAPWYEVIHFGAFLDAYAAVNYNLPRPQTGNNLLRAHDRSNGFALSWVGADVVTDPKPVGGALSLRFGPTAETRGTRCLSSDRAASPCDSDIGLGNIDQAYAAFAVTDDLTLRFGKFVSIYGDEVAESQNNHEYTRGLLYAHLVPWFHTGLMASWRVTRALEVALLAVNGYNASVDNNAGKTFGVKASIAPSDWLELELGWLGGPEQDDQIQVMCPAFTSYDGASRTCIDDPAATQARSYTVDRGGANRLDAWRHMVDFVARVRAGELSETVVHANYGREGMRDAASALPGVTVEQWYGASISTRWEFANDWTAAARLEALHDGSGRVTGIDGATLGSATITVAARTSEHLALMLDNRLDAALSPSGGTRVFPVRAREHSSHQLTTTLGVIVSL